MADWQRPDLIQQLEPLVDMPEVQRLRELAAADPALGSSKYQPLAQAVKGLPELSSEQAANLHVDLSAEHVTIGRQSDLTDDEHDRLLEAIRAMHPWRKGPFRLFGHEIDAEWRSNWKWDRIAEAIGPLHGRKVLDVGCGNGYYMLRAAHERPKLVLGLDPSIQFYWTFELFQHFLRYPNLQYDRLGFQHLYVFDGAFDVGLCMGILYHHSDPIDILRNLRKSIRIGGHAIIESQTIPGEGTMALFPEDRYAKARNVYFVPTKDCMINWVRRSGFKNVELVDHTKVTTGEQRRTDMMTFESLADFLDPDDDGKTAEGYPAPYRTVIRAERHH